MSDSSDDFEIPPFDPRIARRAVRTGTRRLTFRVLAIVAVVFFTVPALDSIYEERRVGHLRDVVLPALAMSLPSYVLAHSDTDGPGLIEAGIHVNGTRRTPTGLSNGDITSFEVLARPFGGVTFRGLPPDGAVESKLSERPEKDATRRLLSELPRRSHLTVVVHLAGPMNERTLRRFRHEYDICWFGLEPLSSEFSTSEEVEARFDDCPRQGNFTAHLSGLLLDPADRGDLRSEQGHFRRRVYWPDAVISSFPKWVAQLKPIDDEDDGLLESRGLSDRAALRWVADRKTATGMVLHRARLDLVAHLLDDGRVASIAVADIAPDLSL